MANFNKVYLMGFLTRDPELRVTPKGTAICSFGIAVNHSYKTESGEQRDDPIFVDLEAWGKMGETIGKYCVKGKPLFIEGRLKFDQWEDKTSGQKRSKLKVVVEGFQFLGGKDGDAGGGEHDHSAGGGQPQSQQQGNQQRRQPPHRQPANTNYDQGDEDVPF